MTKPAGRIQSKGRAKDLPFPATIVLAGRRRCRLTALQAAFDAWCARQGHTTTAIPPVAPAVAVVLRHLAVRAVAGTVEVYQVGPLGVERRREWRVEFDIHRHHDAYLNAANVGYVLGLRGGGSGHKGVVRLIEAGYLAGYEADKETEYVYGYRKDTWNRSPQGRRWRIHPDALADFLQEHPEQYDAAKVRGNPWKAIAAEARRKKAWLRVPEVARRLGCSAKNVRDMLRLGDLQGVHMRDREAITWYVRPGWLLDFEAGVKANPALFARTITGRRGISPERQARRERILAERARLQDRYDPEATRLLCEVRDVGGRRRLAREAAELYGEPPGDEELFPRREREREDPRWRAAWQFIERYGDAPAWDDEAASAAD